MSRLGVSACLGCGVSSSHRPNATGNRNPACRPSCSCRAHRSLPSGPRVRCAAGPVGPSSGLMSRRSIGSNKGRGSAARLAGEPGPNRHRGAGRPPGQSLEELVLQRVGRRGRRRMSSSRPQIPPSSGAVRLHRWPRPARPQAAPEASIRTPASRGCSTATGTRARPKPELRARHSRPVGPT